MNSRMLIMGLAAISMIGMRIDAQTCDSCAAAGTSNQAAAAPAQSTEICEICFPQAGGLFGGLKILTVCRTCACAASSPCAVEAAATEIPVPDEDEAVPMEAPGAVPMETPDVLFCTACAADTADALFCTACAADAAVPAAECASCAVSPVRNAPLVYGARKSVQGVRCMVSGLFGALAEAAATPPPCSPFVQTSNCASCEVENGTVLTTDNVDSPETSDTEQTELPESPKVGE